MATKIEGHAEPIPGYRLMERLGGGGFGEVWKAEAPGGLFKAIKFVFGDIEAIDEAEGARAEQELKALKRVKAVHHPYILSLERIDIIEGQLIIVMELADRTLWDRFKECRARGQAGIPRLELLNYMQETADALDFMNIQHQLQHLDIKPQNIFLIHNHIKVADFGLVKDLQGVFTKVTGGVTPVYAAPETFDGIVSRYSDQYSLAIVYQELLTGQRPFTGNSVRQLILQHLQGTPDLSPLPEPDRAVLARALSKEPDQRFPTCVELIAALRSGQVEMPAAVSVSTNTPIIDRSARTRGPGEKKPAADPAGPLTDDQTNPCRKQRPPLPQPPPSAATPDFLALVEGDPNARSSLVLAISDLLGNLKQPAEPPPASRVISTPCLNRQRKAAEIETPTAVLLPALVIGLGSSGQAVLRRFRGQIQETFGLLQHWPHIRFLCLDTDPEAIQQASRGNETALRPNETFLARLQRASHYLKSKGSQLESWLSQKMLYRIPRQQVPAGVRALGRLAFVDNYAAITRRLEADIEACLQKEPLEQAALRTGLAVAGTQPRVYVVANLASGTGSGMYIDLAYVLQNVLKRLGVAQPQVSGIFFVPTQGRRPLPAHAQTNALAALTELQHFGTGEQTFTAVYGGNDPTLTKGVFTEASVPFQRCLFVPITPEEAGTFTGENHTEDGPGNTLPCIQQAASELFLELCTPLGQAADRNRETYREELIRQGRSADARMLLQTSACTRIIWPRTRLLRLTAQRCCKLLAERWMNKDARPVRERVKTAVEQHWADLRLASDQMIERLRAACEHKLGQAAETLLAGVIEPIAAVIVPVSPGPRTGRNSPAAEEIKLPMNTVMEVIEGLEHWLGLPEGCQSITGPKPAGAIEEGQFSQHFKEAAVHFSNELEVRLAELVVRLIEQPEYRLAGAEETLRQFSQLVEQALQHQEHLTQELGIRSAALYNQLQTLLGQPVPQPTTESGWRLGFSRRPAAANQQFAHTLLELLRAYPKYRFQHLLLQHLTDFYVALRGLLSDQLREVDFCRSRLRELAANFAAETGDTAAAEKIPAVGSGRALLPDGCKTLTQAAQLLERRISEEEFSQLDGKIQEMIRRQFRALVHVCMASSGVLRNLQPAMQAEAEAFLDARLMAADVIEMYFTQQAQKMAAKDEADMHQAIRADLARLFDTAAPALNAGGSMENGFLAAPRSVHEERLRELAQEAFPHSALHNARSTDEIILYRERLFQALADLKLFSPEVQAVYTELTHVDHLTPHTRLDIVDWKPLPQ